MKCNKCDYFNSEYNVCGYCDLTGKEVEADDECEKGYPKVNYEKLNISK